MSRIAQGCDVADPVASQGQQRRLASRVLADPSDELNRPFGRGRRRRDPGGEASRPGRKLGGAWSEER